jgi:hypothetical protein
MKVIQELIAYFDRQGKLTPVHIEKLLKQGLLASEAPDNMVALGHQIGQTFYFWVRGQETGCVWGTDVYTGDSVLAVASVHAGAVGLGETRVVKVTVVEPLQQYRGSTRNGITSHGYGPYNTAYRIAAV